MKLHYTMKYEGMTANEATALIRQTRPKAAPYYNVLEEYSINRMYVGIIIFCGLLYVIYSLTCLDIFNLLQDLFVKLKARNSPTYSISKVVKTILRHVLYSKSLNPLTVQHQLQYYHPFPHQCNTYDRYHHQVL